MTPRIEPGQRWRRKSDGVEVEAVEAGVFLGRLDVSWKPATPGKHRARACWADQFTARYDLIAEAPR